MCHLLLYCCNEDQSARLSGCNAWEGVLTGCCWADTTHNCLLLGASKGVICVVGIGAWCGPGVPTECAYNVSRTRYRAGVSSAQDTLCSGKRVTGGERCVCIWREGGGRGGAQNSRVVWALPKIELWARRVGGSTAFDGKAWLWGTGSVKVFCMEGAGHCLQCAASRVTMRIRHFLEPS